MAGYAFRGTSAFFATELRVQLHEGIAILTSMIVQVVLLVFVSILAPRLLGVALIGAVIFSMFALGQRVQNEAAFIRVDHKLNELYLASPLTPEGYFLGMSLGVLVAYLGPIVLVVAAAEYVVRFSAVAALVLFLGAAAVWLFACSVGYVVSTLFKDMRAIWPYASLFYNLFGVLPPVFYPIALAPPAIRAVALVLPPSAAAALVQSSVGAATISTGEAAVAAVSLVVVAIGSFVFAVYWARRTVREA
jgi:ABC-2 type transport system permease protein